MASYYYLISSLPDLRTDGEMPFSYEEFLGMCQSNVSESKYECLKNLTLSSEEGPIMKEWAASYKNLMSELNYQRSVNLGRPYLASYDKDSVTAQVAGAALAASIAAAGSRHAGQPAGTNDSAPAARLLQ